MQNLKPLQKETTDTSSTNLVESTTIEKYLVSFFQTFLTIVINGLALFYEMMEKMFTWIGKKARRF